MIWPFDEFFFWKYLTFFGRQNQSKISAKGFEIDFSNFIEWVIAGLSSSFDNIVAKLFCMQDFKIIQIFA